MDSNKMHIAVVGGVPPVCGGGGLEVQVDATISALRARGVAVLTAEEKGPVDLIHFIGADPATWNYYRNASGSNARYVLTPVTVLESKLQKYAQRYLRGFRPGMSTTVTMRHELISHAEHVVALHADEARYLVKSASLEPRKVSVIGNGTNAWAERGPRLTAVVCVGTINDRKRQIELLQAWSPELPQLLLCGPLDSNWRRAAHFRELVSRSPNAEWVGELSREAVWSLQINAVATVSWSAMEGESLALVDSIALGRPVIVLGEGGALHAKYPNAVMEIGGTHTIQEVVGRCESWCASPADARPPSWDDVADQLIRLYETVLS